MQHPEPELTLERWLAKEPFALALSSGFFGFFAHAGVLSALERAELLPVHASGSSAGALVTGLWSGGLSAQAIEDELRGLRREHFWDPAPGLGLLRGEKFQSRLESLLSAKTFSACRVPLALSVYDIYRRSTEVLESGELASAIRASCSLPLLFQPTWRAGRPLLDGGILDRPGLAGMQFPRVFYHHLASRSPWRRRGSSALKVPERPGLCALVIKPLPRVNPFKLEVGPEVFRLAEQATLRALKEPVRAGQVVIELG